MAPVGGIINCHIFIAGLGASFFFLVEFCRPSIEATYDIGAAGYGAGCGG